MDREHRFTLLRIPPRLFSGEYLEDRNLDSIARNIALSGLNVFTDSEYFAVSLQDSKGSGYAEVRR